MSTKAERREKKRRVRALANMKKYFDRLADSGKLQCSDGTPLRRFKGYGKGSQSVENPLSKTRP